MPLDHNQTAQISIHSQEDSGVLALEDSIPSQAQLQDLALE
jgi:hypothetical protein